MSLPKLPVGDKYRREVRTEWGGINLNENAGDGELIEATNMSSREFPLLATERMEYAVQHPEADFAAYMQDGNPGWIKRVLGSDDAVSYKLYDPTNDSLVDIPLTFNQRNSVEYAQMRNRMVILPIKKVYDFTDHALTDMEVDFVQTMAFGDNISIQDGIYEGVAAEGNTIYKAGADWGSQFKVGDAVTVSGCVHEGNNKTAIIREIEEDYLRFYENTFENEMIPEMIRVTVGAISPGTYVYFTAPYNGDDNTDFEWTPEVRLPKGTRLGLTWENGEYIVTYAKNGVTYRATAQFTDEPSGYHQVFSPNTFSIQRTVPDLEFVCVNENRVWGCKGDTIYCCKLGDPYNWNVFDGLSTDSWSVETGTPGDFTGCCSYQGYPTFFKEGSAFKVMGDTPQDFVLREIHIVGVAAGSNKSIVEIQGLLYYVSHIGVVQWNGGDYPSVISGALGRSPSWMDVTRPPAGGHGTGAKAGTDGIRYFVWMNRTGKYINWRKNGSYTISYTTRPGLHVYDPRFGTWHMDSIEAETGYSLSSRYEPSFCGDGSRFYLFWVTYTELDSIYDYNTARIQLSLAPEPDSIIPAEWAVTFADSTRAYKTALAGSESKKAVLRLLIRCRLAGSMKVWIAYDGGDFEQAGEFGGEDGMAKNSRVVPLILRRCDFWQLRLTGVGDAVIYSIAVERYGGEWQQA